MFAILYSAFEITFEFNDNRKIYNHTIVHYNALTVV